MTKNSYAFCCPFGTDGSGYDGDGVTPIQSALAIKEYIPDADTLMLDDVGHFCWSDVFGGETVAPGEFGYSIFRNGSYPLLSIYPVVLMSFACFYKSSHNPTEKADHGMEMIQF